MLFASLVGGPSDVIADALVALRACPEELSRIVVDVRLVRVFDKLHVGVGASAVALFALVLVEQVAIVDHCGYLLEVGDGPAGG